VARRGTKRQFRGYTNGLTSLFASTDNAEADGSIPSSPTKYLVKGYFWNQYELSTGSAKVCQPIPIWASDKTPGQDSGGCR
jgi:hypothetical protein